MMFRALTITFILTTGCFTISGSFPTMISHGVSTDSAATGDESSIPQNPYAASSVSVTRGHKIFMMHCQRCHGPQGRGDGPDAKALGVEPGDLAVLAQQYPDYYFYRQIAYGLDDMPSWRDVLKDSEIWDLVNYIKTLNP